MTVACYGTVADFYQRKKSVLTDSATWFFERWLLPLYGNKERRFFGGKRKYQLAFLPTSFVCLFCKREFHNSLHELND